MTNLRDEQLVDRNAAIERVVEIASLDTDHPLALAKREQPFIGKTLEADEDATRRAGFFVPLCRGKYGVPPRLSDG